MAERPHAAARPLALLWTLAIVAGLSLPGDALPEPLWISQDKLIHVGAFLGFGGLWLWAAPHAWRRVLVAGVLFAVVSEGYQHVMPIHRQFSLADIAANLLGLGLAVAVWPRFRRKGSVGGAP
ncbi:MAG: teicoplanin resistance protein VanZ [Rubricoccaceae bacterium]|nr:teicoplanin resistance protein VanZ [Rubricoccaceae bacterium]